MTRRAANIPLSVVVVTAVTMMWTLCSSSLPTNQSSVHYIVSTAMGNFLVAPGMQLQSRNVYLTLSLNNKSACCVACWTDTLCASAGATTTGDGLVECRLSKKAPPSVWFTDDPSATYYFWEAAVKKSNYKLWEDGILYLESTWTKDFTTAQNECKKIPGHRLAIIKTPSHLQAVTNYMENTNKRPWLDLERSNGLLVWGDSTLFDNTTVASMITVLSSSGNPNAKYYYMRNATKVKADTIGSSHAVLCQANPLGVEW